MTDNYDMLLLSIPWSDVELAECGPAVLKGIAQEFGYSIKTHDFNTNLLHTICKSDSFLFDSLQEYFLSSYNPEFQHQNLIDEFYDFIIKNIKNESDKFRYLGLSVFSVYRQRAAWELMLRIRKELPDVKIVLGGRGLATRHHYRVDHYLTSAEKLINFSDIVVKRKMADHLIIGDAEDAIIDLLANDHTDSKLTHLTASSKNLDYPFSNYDDVNFDLYKGIMGRPQLSVISSKGCVRSCDFCDVGAQFKRFSFKSGAKLASEMIYLAERYQIYEFAFTDSIANGNLKSLKETCNALALYNETRPVDQRISWSGNWIARPPGILKPDFFKMAAKSGCRHVTIGAESGSNHVLKSMNKKTTVEGLYYELKHMHNNGIQSNINNIVGHWSERFSDFEEHLEMLLKLGPYYADNTITTVRLTIFNVLQDTPAATDYEYNGIHAAEENFTTQWYTKKNPSLTIKARLARLLIMYQMCLDYGVPNDDSYATINNSVNTLKDSKDKWKKFYDENLDFDNYFVCPSIAVLDNISEFLNNKIKKLFPGTKIVIELDSFSCNGDAEFVVNYNNKEIYKQLLPSGHHKLEFDVPYDHENSNRLEFGLTNKAPMDTLVDKHGNILADKKIHLTSVKIESVELLKEPEYFYQQSQYYEQGALMPEARPGFWCNSSIVFEWKNSFWIAFQKFRRSKRWIQGSINNTDTLIQSKLNQLKLTAKTFDY